MNQRPWMSFSWRAMGLALGLLSVMATAQGVSKGKPAPPVPKSVAGLPEGKALALGERMYREGILPNGEPMESVVSGDIPIAGTAFSCVSCHLRSGLGSWEGGIVTLATNGAKLALPRYWKFPNLSPQERADLKLQNPQARPAYTDQTLATLLRTGIDPGGRELHYAMPRYALKDQEMAILVHYLWSLSAQYSPGVDGDTIRFATIITDEVSQADQQAMLVPMKNYVARHNEFANGFGNRMYLGVGGNEMSGSYRKLSISAWHLKGAPETWAGQLSSFLAKEPVFALIGGLSHGDWQPIHTFCESHRLPCLFPITDFPVVSNSAWYTQYFSKGYFQEGQDAARYLRSLDDPGRVARVLQVIQDGPEGRDLSAGFRETWQELGLPEIKEVHLKRGETLTPASLQKMLRAERPSTVLLWTDAGSFEAIAGLADQSERPGIVFMSAGWLRKQAFGLPEKARAFTRFTFPFRDPSEEQAVSDIADSLLAGLTERHPETRISSRTYSMIQVLRQGLVDMDRYFYRDNFMDRISMQRDQVLPDYLRLSFGPGQRYASKGCYIMELGPGPNPKFVRKSEWVIH